MKKIILMVACMAMSGFAFSTQAQAGVRFVVGVGPGYYGPGYYGYGGPVVYYGPGYYSWHHGYWHGGYCHRVYHHWR